MLPVAVAVAAPALSMDDNEEVVFVERGTVVTNTLPVYNDGDRR